MEMSRLPPAWMDPRGEAKEGTYQIPEPTKEPDDTFLKLYKNQSLMMPSERYKEHLYMKQAKKEYDKDREAIFMYRKRVNALERHYPNGVVGVDGPMHPGTILYADRQKHLLGAAGRHAEHEEARFHHLKERMASDDATACRLPMDRAQSHGPRSRDLGIQRKRVDPELHPQRFQGSHDRLFPKHLPTWDPQRARTLRAQEVRERSHNIISGADNELTYNVAKYQQS